MLRAYLLQTGRQISPFGPLAEVRVHNEPLPVTQERVLRAAGFEVERITSLASVRPGPCLIARDDVYFTRAAVRGLTRLARGRSGNQRAALKVSPLTEAVAPGLQGERLTQGGQELRLYDLFFVRNLDPRTELARQCEPAVIEAPAAKVRSRAHPRFAAEGRVITPISPVFLCPLRHWSNLIACNLLGMAGHLLLEARTRPLAAGMLPLAALLRAGSVRPGLLAGKTYFRGPKCRIHPTAHVECATLGRRVRIGPHAVVRFSAIGDGAEIGPGAQVEGCSVGPRATINGGVLVRGTICGAQAAVGACMTQMSVLGDRVVLCPESGLLDYSLRGTVPVNTEEGTVRSGALILGSALGHDTFLGPNVLVACGRELPAGCVLVRNPREQVRSGAPDKLPADLRRLDRNRAA